MEVLIGLSVLGVAACGIYQMIQKSLETPQRRPPPPPVTRPVVRRPNPAMLQRQQRDAQSRAFQTALLQLAATPDFRRAATLVAAARLVPVEFRRRQFNRFRSSFVAHYRRCLTTRGTNEEILLQSLRQLVVGLGVASFEADYIQSIALGALNPVKPVASPTNRLTELKRAHQTRVEAIQAGLADNPELLEQMLEAEENRFRQALETLFDGPSAPAGGPPI